MSFAIRRTFITKRKEEHGENGPDGDDTNNIKGGNAPNLKQASIALRQGKSMIIAGLAESKKDHAIELLAKLKVGMDELHKIAEDRKREAVVHKQNELFQYVGGIYIELLQDYQKQTQRMISTAVQGSGGYEYYGIRVANSSRVVDANEEVHDTRDQDSSTRKRRPRGVNLNKNILADSS
nr:peptidyl-prolyl cis-trans isomerase CYP38, chloroplastic [Tanacetum cinerariifolium]